MNLNKYKETLNENKNYIAYTTIGLAGLIFLAKYLFGGEFHVKNEKILKRRKISKKIQNLFEFKEDTTNVSLKFTHKDDKYKSFDNYTKLQEFTNTMVSKALVKEEVINAKSKQDYIFYQILNGMQGRFKQKTIMN